MKSIEGMYDSDKNIWFYKALCEGAFCEGSYYIKMEENGVPANTDSFYYGKIKYWSYLYIVK